MELQKKDTRRRGLLLESEDRHPYTRPTVSTFLRLLVIVPSSSLISSVDYGIKGHVEVLDGTVGETSETGSSSGGRKEEMECNSRRTVPYDMNGKED